MAWSLHKIEKKKDLIITWDTLMSIYGVCVRLPLCSSIFFFLVYIFFGTAPHHDLIAVIFFITHDYAG